MPRGRRPSAKLALRQPQGYRSTARRAIPCRPCHAAEVARSRARADRQQPGRRHAVCAIGQARCCAEEATGSRGWLRLHQRRRRTRGRRTPSLHSASGSPADAAYPGHSGLMINPHSRRQTMSRFSGCIPEALRQPPRNSRPCFSRHQWKGACSLNPREGLCAPEPRLAREGRANRRHQSTRSACPWRNHRHYGHSC